jgi:pimeloyl-ACP methyl ester carboxylesterase
MATVTEQRGWAHWTEPSWLTSDGELPTAYRRKGSGDPLVYFHGAGMTRMWLPLYDELSRSFDTIVPEHPGYGDTPLPDWLAGFDDMVLHYDTVFERLGLDRAHLVGHSLGGWVAANFAIFYPSRVASLTLIAPLGLRVPEDSPVDMFRLSPEGGSELLFSGVAERYLDYLVQGDDLENTLHEYGEAITLARLMWNPRYDRRLDFRLGRVVAPTLVVAPADDRMVPRSHSERYAELIPNARLVTVEGARDEPASHAVIVQQPQELGALITNLASALTQRDA